MSHKGEERNEQGSCTIPPEVTTVNTWATPPGAFFPRTWVYIHVLPNQLGPCVAGAHAPWRLQRREGLWRGREGKTFSPLRKGTRANLGFLLSSLIFQDTGRSWVPFPNPLLSAESLAVRVLRDGACGREHTCTPSSEWASQRRRSPQTQRSL